MQTPRGRLYRLVSNTTVFSASPFDYRYARLDGDPETWIGSSLATGALRAALVRRQTPAHDSARDLLATCCIGTALTHGSTLSCSMLASA